MLSYIFTLLMPFYIIFAIIFILGVASKTKSVKATLFNLFIVILIPAHDMIPTNILAWYHCKFDASPQTFVKKKVEYPISIYWTSSITSGFSENGRKLMIINYLDGVHLKTMALNGDDGKVYVYTRDVPKGLYESLSLQLLQEENRLNKLEKELSKHELSKEPKHLWIGVRDARLEAMKKVDVLRYQVRALVDSYPADEKVYTKETMPKMNYTVTFNEVKLPTLSSKFLYSDETKVIENNTSEIVAYNRRYMRFFYHAAADIEVGNRPYYPEPMCGYKFTRNFDEMVFPSLKYLYFGEVSGSAYRENQNKHTTGAK
jgi:hypothetical protein